MGAHYKSAPLATGRAAAAALAADVHRLMDLTISALRLRRRTANCAAAKKGAAKLRAAEL